MKMVHHKKNELWMGRIALFLFILFLIILVRQLDSGITGAAVYQNVTLSKIWDFTSLDGYSYDPSSLETASGQLQMISITSTIYGNTSSSADNPLVKVLYGPSDKTTKVNSPDNEKFEVKDSKIFDIFFHSELNNGDTVSLLIPDGDEGIIYLCDAGTVCSAPGYGQVTYSPEDNENNNDDDNKNDGENDDDEDDENDGDNESDGDNDDSSSSLHNITLSGLSSSTKALNLVVEEKAKIDFITSSSGDISQAWSDPGDKTSRLSSVDNDRQEVTSNKLLSIILDEEMDNGDMISIYVTEGPSGKIYLCAYGTVCTTDNYGSMSYDRGEGWYNITLASIPSVTSYLSVNTPTMKIDSISANIIEITEHSLTSTTIPSSATIETADFAPNNLVQWSLFSSSEQLQDQAIAYQYS